MKIFYNKSRYGIVMMVVLAMLLQIIVPVAESVYAQGDTVRLVDGNFAIEAHKTEKGKATVSWEYVYRPGEKTEYELNLGSIFEQYKEESGVLIADEGEIGEYTISQDGAITINIDENIEEIVRELREEIEIPKEPEVPEVPVVPEDDAITDDNKDDDTDIEGEEETDGSEVTDETEEDDEGITDDSTDIIETPETEEPATEEPVETGRIGKPLVSLAFIEDIEELYLDDESYTFEGSFEVEGIVVEAEQPKRMTFAAGTDLGNIFTDVVFKVDDKEINHGDIIPDISDGTRVTLDYKWNTMGLNVKAGDTAEIQIPDIFRIQGNFNNRDLVLTGGEVVGSWSIVDDKLKITFNEEIESFGEVDNGVLGLGLSFNIEKFKEDVVQRIEFNDSTNKTLTITAKPNVTIGGISKEGEPDDTRDAKNITWIIDIVNMEGTPISNATVEDIIPSGLKLEDIKVYNLSIGYEGKKTKGGEATFTEEEKTDNKFKLKFDSIDSYKGYRIEYITKITDYSESATFTNNAHFKYSNKDLTADATVSGLERSKLIEKGGSYLGDDVIEWFIDINKPFVGIDNAIIEEDLPSGLTVVPNSIELYKLNGSGDNWSQGDKVDGKMTIANPYGFPVTLGKVEADQAYRIKFKTNINYDGDYVKTDNEFKNEVILKNGTTEIGTAEKTVDGIVRDPIIEKTEISNINYNDKFITWQLEINKAQHPLKGVQIVDTLPAGLDINKGNIEIYEADGTTKATAFPNKDWITISPDPTDKAKSTLVTMKLGDIGKNHYKIKYTTDITNFGIGNFTNSANISGTGIGTRPEWNYSSKTISINENIYTKNSTGIDYGNKTISWKITVNPLREPIKELKITDTFPNKGLILLDDETFVVKQGGTPLAKGTDYILTPRTEDGVEGYQKGFEIKFINITEANKLSNEVITIDYKTSFDPEKVIDQNTSTTTKDKYQNKARFEVKTNTRDIDVTSIAKVDEIISSWNSGKKEGRLINIDNDKNRTKGWKSGNTRKIEWQVYINYLEQNLGTGVSVKDRLGYEGKIDEDSIEVKKYNVNVEGETSYDAQLHKDNYDIKMDSDGKGFTLNFKSSFTVHERYVIVYTTSVPEISQGTYTNTATTTKLGNDKEYSYTGSIDFDKANDNLSKNAIGVVDKKVYTDDELKWEVLINESISIIDNVVITDTISDGLVYLEDSMKVYKIVGTTEVELTEGEGEAYKLTKTKLANGKTELKVIFNGKIDSTHKIKYTTIVTEDDGTVNNTVAFSGEKITVDSVETERLTAKQYSYTGGDPAKGKIKVIKVDEDGNKITSSKTIFALWYELNGEDQKFGNKDFETINGELEIGNLPLNRTYYLEEVKPPKEYVESETRYEIKVEKAFNNNNSNIYEQKVENKKIKGNIEFKKVDELGKQLQGVTFTLYKGADVVATAKSDSDGKISFKDVEYGNYTIEETATIDGYILYEGTLHVSIGDEDNGETINPMKDAETITEVVNIVKKGNIEINKVDGYGEPLAGAKFKLYKDVDGERGEEVGGYVESDGSGLVRFENVPYGDYIIREFKAPDSYAPSDREVKVSIREDEKTVKPIENDPIVNSKIIGDIQVIKLDEDGETGLPGAVFILEQDGEEKYRSDETDEYGSYVFKNIKYGTYILKEIAAPEGYNLINQEEVVEIKEQGQELIIRKFENTKIRGSVKLRKLGEDREGLQGAEFSIYKSTDVEFTTPISTATSDVNGDVIFTNVEYGKYNIKETKAPEGYNLSDKVIENVEITIEGEEVIPTDNEISNTKIRGSIEILKRNRNTHRPLANAKIGLFTEEAILIGEKITGIDGKVIFEGLEYGRYYFKETKAPSGYILDNTKYYFDIEDNDVMLERQLDNRRIPTEPEPIDPDPTDPEPPVRPPVKPPTKPPVDPEKPTEPTEPVDPTEPVEITEVPEPEEPEIPIVITPPKGGTVEFDEDGNWKYTPNPKFTGKDSFVLKHPDGTEELIEIDVDAPLGGTDADEKAPTLPKTGQVGSILIYLAGLFFIVVGIVLRRRTV